MNPTEPISTETVPNPVIHQQFSVIDPFTLIWQIFNIVCIILLIVLVIRFFRRRRNPNKATPQPTVQTTEEVSPKPLSEVLAEHRIRCAMTQEFVAEAMGVSRQAVSKWENGTADPSTSNLLKLAQLYGVTPEDLIRSIRAE